MNKAEFKQKLEDEFFVWASDRDRSESIWWSTLESYAQTAYHNAYDKEHHGD